MIYRCFKYALCSILPFLSSLGYCQYYSQPNLEQDRFVNERYFHNKPTGFFVDIGAHSGVLYSNSYFFEKLGWDGVCFEPDPRTFPKLQANRDCYVYNAAVGAKHGTEQFYAHPVTWMSGLEKTYNPMHFKKWHVGPHRQKQILCEVDVVTFNEVMEEIGVYKVDFLSIDTEGAELEILMSIDYDRFYIHVMTIENFYNDKRIPEFLESKGFKHVTNLMHDEIYVNTKEFTP